ncbi:helix-turn-helix domain-containing protein [Prevotella pallens]|uniref:helix-turn-helix domain-containing protein n=2 Tax=Prevotella pallens TaxID=60133 RepID=UPI002490208A|nr:helix-turn-helix domain-containing protein [Prevotella pallens]
MKLWKIKQIKNKQKRHCLNESFRLFLKKGHADVSFSDLVEATNVSRGNMFHHFKNKEDIFHHAVDSFEFTIDQEM